MRAGGDPIAVVEACYDATCDDVHWIQGIADSVQALPLKRSLGTVAYHISGNTGGVNLHGVVQSGSVHDVAARLNRLGRLLQRYREGRAGFALGACTKVYVALLKRATRLRPDEMLLEEYRRGEPRWMHTLGVPGARDVLLLVNNHVDGLGSTVVARGLAEPGSLRPAERRMYQMLGAHIKAGYRLRARGYSGADIPNDGAVIDGTSLRLLAAHGDARSAGAREVISRSVTAVDRARTERHGRDQRALEVWQGLIDGRWSLVEHVDTDGKRLILAHRNPEGVRDPRGLTDMEARVVALAAQGHANKMIGYHLGVAEGTVATHLHWACRKLHTKGRGELVRLFGRGGDQERDDREL